MQTTDTPTTNPPPRMTLLLPLLWVSLAFLAGIVAGDRWPIPAYTWLILMGVALAAGLLVRILLPRLAPAPDRFPLSVFLLVVLSIVAFCFGAARLRLSVPPVDEHNVAWYRDGENELLLTGTVAGPPDVRDTYTNIRLDTTSISTGDLTFDVSGPILARIARGRDLHYGDVVRVRGHLVTPPSNEAFSYQEYLARQGILAYMPDAEATILPFTGGDPVLRLIYAFKDKALARIQKIFPAPEAALMAGILLGDDNGMPAGLKQAYKNTGTAHIIAISGFNIAILAGLFMLLFSRLFGPRWGALTAVAAIVVYTILVGASASVVRAAIMGGVSILAVQTGRRQNGLNTLAFTAAVMTLVDPNILWEVGFQLSFAATLGLVLFGTPLMDWFTALLSRRMPNKTARRIAAPVGEFVFFTWAAQLTTLPLMAYHFGQISLVSVLANPFILPAQPFVMILGGLALLLSYISIPLGKIAGWIAWPFAAYTNRAVEFFNGLPHGVIFLREFSAIFVVLIFAVLLLFTLPAGRLRAVIRPLLTPAVILAVLGIATYLFWAAALSKPDGNLHLTFVEAGSSDAVIIETPSGRTLLVNGGKSSSVLADAIGRRLSPFDRRLDWLIVASPQEQQVAALPRFLDLAPPENVLWAGNSAASYSAGETERWLTANQIPVTQAFTGATLDLGEGATLTALNVSTRGAVLLIEWNGFRALLPLGVNFDTLEKLENGKSIGTVTVLLVADSGYGPSNPPEWIDNLRPQVAILSVAAGDMSGLPHPDVLDQLGGTTLLRTDVNGWIEVSSDGQGFWVDVERK